MILEINCTYIYSTSKKDNSLEENSMVLSFIKSITMEFYYICLSLITVSLFEETVIIVSTYIFSLLL